MIVKMSTLLWHDASLMSPTKDGKYLVEWWGSIDMMQYTKECGWNTFRDKEGNVDPSTAIEIEDGNITVWAEPPVIVERSLDDSVE